MRKKILIIEDNKKVLEILSFALGREGYQIIRTTDGLTGIQLAEKELPDLIILDITPSVIGDMPPVTSEDVCRYLQEDDVTTYVIGFASTDEAEKELLASGADECIRTPFAMRELLSRVRANTWHLDTRSADRVGTMKQQIVGRLVIDPEEARILKDGEPLDLSQREYRLICFLAKEPGKVFSREELLHDVWDYPGYVGDVRAVDVTIRRIREKIEDDPSKPTIIITRRGHGYLFAL